MLQQLCVKCKSVLQQTALKQCCAVLLRQLSHLSLRRDFKVQGLVFSRQGLDDVRGRELGAGQEAGIQVHSRQQMVPHHRLQKAARFWKP